MLKTEVKDILWKEVVEPNVEAFRLLTSEQKMAALVAVCAALRIGVEAGPSDPARTIRRRAMNFLGIRKSEKIDEVAEGLAVIPVTALIKLGQQRVNERTEDIKCSD